MAEPQSDTSPVKSKANPDSGNKAPEPAAPKIKSYVATEFWLELLIYPPPKADAAGKVPKSRLWLLVKEGWRFMDDPSAEVQTSVQSAFGQSDGLCEVVAWYGPEHIVGLVVRSKYPPV